jgi:TolB protein
VTAGLHNVRLLGTAGNCSVGATTVRAVTVPPEGAANVTFDVGCVVTERVAYSSPGTIIVGQLDGSVTLVIARGFAPAWSPDGARLAYECGEDICAINADSTGFARLTVDATGNHHPTWSPDRMKIAFAATHDGTTDLYVMAANGGGAVRLTQSVGFVGKPAWSPDGTRIVFDCRVDAGNDDLCSINTDGTGFARLTTDPARDYGAAWKPDGSTLAFATTRYGGDQIALLNLAEGGITRAGLDGYGPTWSPDGSQLAFVQTLEECGGWDYSRAAASGGTRSARRRGVNSCNTYDAIFVAHSDGSDLRVFTTGNQPAWRPHP